MCFSIFYIFSIDNIIKGKFITYYINAENLVVSIFDKEKVNFCPPINPDNISELVDCSDSKYTNLVLKNMTFDKYNFLLVFEERKIIQRFY